MKILDYISKDFKPFTLETPIAEVRFAMSSYSFSHFPVTDSGKLVGLLPKDDFLNLSEDVLSVIELRYMFQHFYTQSFDNHFDLINLLAQYDTNLLPLVDDKRTYLGYFELGEILQLCNNTPFFQKESTTLLIEKENTAYSMSEIVQIVETNKVKLLGMYVSNIDSVNTQITIRISTENPNEVIQSLRRYKYHVLTNSKDDFLLEQLKEHSDYLQKYLEI